MSLTGDEESRFLIHSNKYEWHSCSGSVPGLALGMCSGTRLALPLSQLRQKWCMTQQNTRCAVIKILNAEWEAAADWESTRGLAIYEWAEDCSSAPGPEHRRGSWVSVWAAADALCSFISYKH